MPEKSTGHLGFYEGRPRFGGTKGRGCKQPGAPVVQAHIIEKLIALLFRFLRQDCTRSGHSGSKTSSIFLTLLYFYLKYTPIFRGGGHISCGDLRGAKLQDYEGILRKINTIGISGQEHFAN